MTRAEGPSALAVVSSCLWTPCAGLFGPPGAIRATFLLINGSAAPILSQANEEVQGALVPLADDQERA